MQQTTPMAPGTQIGDWELCTLLGRGGQGTTWIAKRSDGQDGVLKVLTSQPGDELRTLARLSHPAIVALLDAGSQPVPHLVMERAPGHGLRTWLEADALSEDDVAQIGVQLFDALATLRRAGVVHADIKPENLIVDRKDGALMVQLVDFGLAMTHSGGTFAYLAPEVLDGCTPSSEGDVYMAGLVLWEILHGSLPWDPHSLQARLVTTPSAKVGPMWLRELLSEVLSPRPARRPSADQLADRFAAHGYPIPQQTPARLAAAAARLYLPDPTHEAVLGHWQHHGGVIAIVGPEGSGRRRLMARLRTELAARGTPFTVDATDDTSTALVLDALPEDPAPIAAAAARGRTIAFCAASAPDWAEALVLRPWSQARREAMAAALLGIDQLPVALCKGLSEEARQWPGAACRYTIDAITTGALKRATVGWVWDPLAAQRLRAQELCALHGLSPLAQDVARTLAVDGGVVPTATLAAGLGCSAAALASAAAELTDAGLLAQRPGGLCCAEPVFAERIAAQPEAAPFHAASLAARVSDPATATSTLARHALGGGDVTLLGERAPAVVRYASAVDPEGAARLADTLWADSDEPEHLAVRLLALSGAGRTEEALALGETLLSKPCAHDEALLIELASLQGTQKGDAEAAVRTLEAALSASAAPSQILQLSLASGYFSVGRHRDAIRLAEQAGAGPMPISESAQKNWLQARYIWAQSVHADGDLQSAVALLEEIPAEVIDSSSAVGGALSRLYWFAGRYREAAAVMQRAADNHALPLVDRARLHNNLGAIHYRDGARRNATADWETALAMFQLLGAQTETVRAQVNLCLGYLDLGRWERSRQIGQQALTAAASAGEAELEIFAADNLAQLALARNKPEEARGLLDRADAVLACNPGALAGPRAEIALRQAETAALLDPPSLARQRAERARQLAKVADQNIEACLAEVLIACARSHEPAYDIPSTVWGALEAIDDPLERARGQLWLARAFAARGEHGEAHKALESASQEAQRQKVVPLAQQAEKLRTQLDRRSGIDNHTLDHIIELAQRIGTPREQPALLQELARAAAELLQGDRAFVLLGQPPTVASAWGDDSGQHNLSMSVVEQAIEECSEVLAVDLADRDDLAQRDSIVNLDLRAVLCVPLVRGDEAIGAIYVDSKTASRRRMLQAARLMRVLAALGAVAVLKARYHTDALEQARRAARLAERECYQEQIEEKNRQLEALNIRLQRQASYDELTGLRNRRSFISAVSARHAESTAYGLCLADIDHFKRFNDTWGHHVGDNVLQQVARVFNENLGELGEAFRYGGEEIVIITHVPGPAVLDRLCEQLRAALESSPLVVSDTETVTITASFGSVWRSTDTPHDWAVLLQQADEALYQAKDGGRNRCLRWQPGEEEDAAVA